MGMTDLALRRATDPTQIDWLTKGAQASRHLLAIISDILDISRIEAGQLALEEKNFSLARAVDESVRMLEAQALAKGLQLSLHINPTTPDQLCGDALRLKQILLNFVGNAIKFSQRGAVTVTVRLVGEDDGRARLKFSVTDSGPGLAPAFQQRAFDLFSQGPDSQGSVNGGVGLGLGIVKSLVDLMGGQVEVDSVQDVGSTFSFTIPLEPTAAVVLPPVVRGATEATKPCRVLLVDDNAAGRQVSGSLLAHLGAVVTPASGGQEALDSYTSNPEGFDLVLMDVRMPDMDGHEATRRLREWEATAGQGRHVQVVALTANSAPSDQLQARAAGMDGYLTKPVRLIDLRNLLRNAQTPGK